MTNNEIYEKRDSMNEKFNQAVGIEEQAERSTFMDAMRAEVVELYNNIARLTTEAQELQEKNKKLVEANSELFTRVGYTKADPQEKEKSSQGVDLDKFLKD